MNLEAEGPPAADYCYGPQEDNNNKKEKKEKVTSDCESLRAVWTSSTDFSGRSDFGVVVMYGVCVCVTGVVIGGRGLPYYGDILVLDLLERQREDVT